MDVQTDPSLCAGRWRGGGFCMSLGHYRRDLQEGRRSTQTCWEENFKNCMMCDFHTQTLGDEERLGQVLVTPTI